NRMLAQIRQQSQMLAASRDQLEERVRERTRELEAATADAQAANRAKTYFLANMSHEIRTPMTAIIGYSEMLLDPGLTPQERLDSVQTVRRNGEHLLSIINDILDITKIEAGKMTVERLGVSLVQIVADAASITRIRAIEKGL